MIVDFAPKRAIETAVFLLLLGFVGEKLKGLAILSELPGELANDRSTTHGGDLRGLRYMNRGESHDPKAGVR